MRRTDTRFLYLGLAIAFLVVYTVNLYAQAGTRITAIISLSMVGGILCWLTTTWRRPADPRRIFPMYVLMMALFVLHVLEEFVTDFGPRVSVILGNPWPESEFILTIMLLGPMVWIGSAVGLYYRNPFANFIVWFMLVGMVLGEPIHLLFPILEGGRYHYFPGMWTALLPMVPAIYAIYLLVSEHRAAVRAGGSQLARPRVHGAASGEPAA